MLDLAKQLANLVPEEPLHRILFRPNLVTETVKADEGDMRGLAFSLPMTEARDRSKKSLAPPSMASSVVST